MFGSLFGWDSDQRAIRGSVEAIAVAAAAEPAPAAGVAAGLGFEPGQPVMVSAIGYGADPVDGTLVGLTLDEAVIARDDDRAGRVHVHFPRHGFTIRKKDRSTT